MLRISIRILGQPFEWYIDLGFLPQKGQRVQLDHNYFEVHESFMKLDTHALDAPRAEMILKSAAAPEPIGPGSITKTDFASLRGKISRHGRAQFNLAHAGAQPPEDAEEIRKDAETAREEVFAALLKMEKGLGL